MESSYQEQMLRWICSASNRIRKTHIGHLLIGEADDAFTHYSDRQFDSSDVN